MKLKINLFIVISMLALIIVSCDRPDCKNENPIFDKYNINSAEYKIELRKQIEKYGQKELQYWFESYIEDNGKEYIIVNVQNNSLCAKAMILVNDWSKIENIKRTKGKGYTGAKLKGLVFEFENDSNKTELIYKDIKRVVD